MASHGMDQDRLKRRLDTLLSGWVEKGTLPCITAQVSRRGHVVYEGTFGQRDLENGEALKKDDIFRIYSMTKVFTSVAMLILHEQGLYQMWDPVSKYLPEYKDTRVAELDSAGRLSLVKPRREMTIRDLFTMTSGIPYPDNNTPSEEGVRQVWNRFYADAQEGNVWPTRRFAREIASAPLSFHPGEHWWYGQSYEILGALVEVLSGKRLSAFYKEYLFDPLGMTDTSFYLPPEKRHRFVSMYELNDQGGWQRTAEDRDVQYLNAIPFETGGGGLVSTLEDVSRFARMLTAWGHHEGGQILSRKSIELMRRNHLNEQQMKDYNWPSHRGYGYGLGVRGMISPEIAGFGSPGEFGWGGAAGTWFAMDPEEALCLVYLVQIMPGREGEFAPNILQTAYSAITD